MCHIDLEHAADVFKGVVHHREEFSFSLCTACHILYSTSTAERSHPKTCSSGTEEPALLFACIFSAASRSHPVFLAYTYPSLPFLKLLQPLVACGAEALDLDFTPAVCMCSAWDRRCCQRFCLEGVLHGSSYLYWWLSGSGMQVQLHWGLLPPTGATPRRFTSRSGCAAHVADAPTASVLLLCLYLVLWMRRVSCARCMCLACWCNAYAYVKRRRSTQPQARST